ncbi:MAG: hypothetical protein ACFFDN_25090 [Candidatus Hodarchaeota archaeon]
MDEIYKSLKQNIIEHTRFLISTKNAKNIQIAEMLNNYLDATDKILHLIKLNNIALRAEVKAHEDSLIKLIKNRFESKDEIMKSYLKILNDFRQTNKELPIG